MHEFKICLREYLGRYYIYIFKEVLGHDNKHEADQEKGGGMTWIYIREMGLTLRQTGSDVG